MTDKQIIIDGVDVSGCEYCGYDNVCKLKSASNYIVDCKDNPNCHYKQLKRKEQECEELKNTLDVLLENNLGLRHTLTEIKEIAEYAKTKVFVDMEEFWKQILQKISEVECEN